MNRKCSSPVMMDQEWMERLDIYIKEHMEYICNLTSDICSIPSATGDEERKANYVLGKIREITGGEGWKDAAGNVLYHIDSGMPPKATLVTAHIDTVFENQDVIRTYRQGQRIYGPSVWDNSVNIAGLIFCIKMIHDLKPSIGKSILAGFDVGEEGFGNLKGIRHIMEDWEGKIDEVIALDLGYERIINKAVGSRRYSVLVQTKGGHSWSAFGEANAIVYASQIVAALYDIKIPAYPKTTYNAGLIHGGISVNTIAPQAEIIFDFRSEEEKSLLDLEQKFFDILKGFSQQGVEIRTTLLGERPCGKEMDMSDLIGKISDIRNSIGLDTEFSAASTDANVPLSLGIPAVSFGVCNGSGAHTQEEYIQLDTLETGIKQLVYFLLKD